MRVVCRCTCFFMEADKVVTHSFDVSMLPTTDLIDTARMPLCTYSVHRSPISPSFAPLPLRPRSQWRN